MRWLNQDGDEILGHALNSILRHGNRVATGLEWPMTLDDQSYGKMPNFSHGTAGIAATLAIVGHHLGRQDALDAALLGAEHVVAIADTDDGLFRVETMIPIGNRDIEQYAYGWCHGPTGTAYMFAALDHAGIHEVSGVTCDEWITRALRTVETSGVPDRIRPGFWDNDGRCCGTAGVLDFALDVIQRHPDAVDFEFADRLADALVARAIRKNGQAYWRFTEHRRENPLLDPVTGWMQGAAGIAAALMRYHRVRQDPSGASRQSRPESWWMVD
jgi:lantibiotic modifying enzyme